MVTVDSVSYKSDQKEVLTKGAMKALLEEVLASRELQLIKPLEQQALFIAGKLSQENRELREKMELVLSENSELREKFKALPAPVEKITDEFHRKEQQLGLLRQENRQLGKKLQIEVECTRTAREAEKRLSGRLREREAIINELEVRIKEVFLEEARARAELEENWKSGMEELRQKLEEEEAAQAHLKSEWVKTVAALKEAQKPWWMKMLGIR